MWSLNDEVTRFKASLKMRHITESEMNTLFGADN